MAFRRDGHYVKKALALTLVVLAGLLFWLPAFGATDLMGGKRAVPNVGGGPPPIPAEYAGNVKVNNALARDGAKVYGKVGDYQSQTKLVKDGKYKNLTVTAPAGWGTIEFYVDDVKANETSEFVAGSINTSFDLTVGGATPTPTPTPTPSPTPTPEGTATPTPSPTPTPPAASNQIPLVAEWNLISVHWPLQDPSITAVFSANPEVSRVFSIRGDTLTYAVRGEAGWNGPLTQIQDGVGYYVFATAPGTLTITPKSDPLTTPPSYALPEGWSEIGFTSRFAFMPIDTYLASLSGNWISLYRIGPDGGWQLAKSEGLRMFTQMDAGSGYWINLRSAGTLTPP